MLLSSIKRVFALRIDKVSMKTRITFPENLITFSPDTNWSFHSVFLYERKIRPFYKKRDIVIFSIRENFPAIAPKQKFGDISTREIQSPWMKEKTFFRPNQCSREFDFYITEIKVYKRCLV